MRKLFISLAFMFMCLFNAHATHILGGEFYYQHISGNTYRLNLVLYGDCSSTNQTSFNNLWTSTPRVTIKNGSTLIGSINLALDNSSITDITPLCPGQTSTCSGGSVDGIMRFKYTGTYTLPFTSTNWKFMATGQLPPSNLLGRSNAITNILIPGGGSIMALECTLNNVAVSSNNSPIYTSLPTPYFCVNTPQNFNQGAIDPDGDNMSFALTPGIDSTFTSVTYIAPYSSTAPLAVTAGTFNFNTSNGQLSFLPNLTQYSLVVTKVTEIRAGVIVGTSMREMVFVGINCSNSPPSSTINTSTTSIIDSPYSVLSCGSSPNINFVLNPSDPNGNNINVTYTGLPGSSTLSILNNNTPNPLLTFNWNLPTGTPSGNYTFYITYQDDACPLSSSQTIAYTVKLKPAPSISSTATTVNCIATPTGSITISGSGTVAPYTYSTNGTTYVSTNTFNSLMPGIYTVYVKDANGCTVTQTATINLNQPPTITSVSLTSASCVPGNDGAVTVTATTNPSGGSLTYSNGGVTYVSTSSFTNLGVGTYTIYVKDINGCTNSTIVNVVSPPGPAILGVTKTNATCEPGCDGSITSINAPSALSFNINGGLYQTTSVFNNLCVGTYTVNAKDINGCTNSTIVNIVSPPSPTISSVTLVTASCVPGCDGAINNIIASSPNGAIQFSINGTIFQTANNFSGLCTGNYTLTVKDILGCATTSNISIITQPNPLITSAPTTEASCFPGCDGTVAVNASSTLTLTYSTNGGAFVASNFVSSLCVGTYTVVVKDSKGCTSSTAVNIVQAQGPSITNTIFSNITCAGKNDGIIDVDATSTNGTITYTLNPSSATDPNGLFTNLAPGTYTVTVSDPKNCNVDEIFTLIEPAVLQIDEIKTKDIQCQNYNDGIISVVAIGGNNSYTYNITPGSTSNNNGNFAGLAPGDFTITVTDAKGCNITTLVNLKALYNPMSVEVTVNNIECSGAMTDGTASINVIGGSPPFIYTWQTTPTQYGQTATNLFGGVYKFAIQDAFGCVWYDSAVLEDPTHCCNQVFVPNAFTPNNDGTNDNLMIKTNTNITVEQFYIYNRWGEQIWRGNNLNDLWDGYYKERLCELGTYFYILKYHCNINDKDYSKKGDILLIR